MKKLMTVVLCILMAVGMAGCSKEPSPSDGAAGFIEAFKSQDQEKMNACVDGELDSDDFFNFDTSDTSKMTEEQQAAVDTILKKLSEAEYSLKDEKEDGEKASVKASITTYNLGDKFKSGFQEAITTAFALAFDDSLSDEEKNNKMNDILIQHLTAIEKTYSKDVTIQLNKVEEQWLIDPAQNEELFDALSGGAITIKNELNASFHK